MYQFYSIDKPKLDENVLVKIIEKKDILLIIKLIFNYLSKIYTHLIKYITYNKFVSKLSSMLIFAKGNGV